MFYNGYRCGCGPALYGGCGCRYGCGGGCLWGLLPAALIAGAALIGGRRCC